MSQSLHAHFSRSVHKTIFGETSNLVMPVLLNKTLAIAAQKINPREASLLTWIKSFFFRPITIIDDQTGQSTRVLVRIADAVSKLKTLGLSSESIKSALKQDNILDLVLEKKALKLYSSLPNGLVSLDHIKNALLWINEHGTGPLKSIESIEDNNPIKIEKRGPHYYFVINQHRINIDESESFLDDEALRQAGFNEDEIEKVADIFEYTLKAAKTHFLSSKAPIVLSPHKKTLSDNYNFGSRYNITFISPQDAFLPTNKKLGSGTYKTVSKVINLITGKSYASYTMNFPTTRPLNEDQKACYQEIIHLKTLGKKPGLVKLYDIIETPSSAGLMKVQVILKLYNLGSLQEVLRRYHLDDVQKLSVTKQLVSGLKILHDKGLIHRDFKPENILVKKNKEGSLKVAISDFGGLIRNDDQDKKNIHMTTCWYASPEYARAFILNSDQAKQNAVCPALDMWSLGVVLYQLYHNRLPEWIENLSHEQKISDAAVLNSISQVRYPIQFPSFHPMNAFISKLITPQEERFSVNAAQDFLNRLA